MNQQQLIRAIEQQLENLMSLDEDLAYQYEYDLYYENEEPLVREFTPKLLEELTQLVYELEDERTAKTRTKTTRTTY